MRTHVCKVLGCIIALVGGLAAIGSSFSHFFTGHLVTNVSYNTIDKSAYVDLTIVGILILLCGIGAVVTSLMTFKHHHVKGAYISLGIIGIILLLCASFWAGIICLIGSIIGFYGRRCVERSDA